jgi:hypothetical protein
VWEFARGASKPLRVLLQASPDAPDRPVSMMLLHSAPPPRPEVLAQIVLPADPPQAGVDLAVDPKTALAFPNDSFLGAGAFGQARAQEGALARSRPCALACSASC